MILAPEEIEGRLVAASVQYMVTFWARMAAFPCTIGTGLEPEDKTSVQVTAS